LVQKFKDKKLLLNLFMFISAGWEPGTETHLVRNWVKKSKQWGVQNMGEAKLDTATGDNLYQRVHCVCRS